VIGSVAGSWPGLAVLVTFVSKGLLSRIPRWRLSFRLSLFGLLFAPGLAAASTLAPPLHQRGARTNSDPVLFVLCNWGSQWSYQPNSLAYDKDLWIDSASGGFHFLADYWRQVSFGQTKINGSAELDGRLAQWWYSMNRWFEPTCRGSRRRACCSGGGDKPISVRSPRGAERPVRCSRAGDDCSPRLGSVGRADRRWRSIYRLCWAQSATAGQAGR
jgi:hypothetical protein